MAVRAEGATKVYGRGDTAVRALDGVSVALPAGRFTAVMGPSGSGKSTLMHCLAGLDDLTGGQVFLGDVELSGLSDKALTRLRRDRIGFVFQSFNLIPTLSAAENITLPMDLAGRKPDRAWLDSVIDAVGLRDRLKHRPSELSGGQQQRVAVARALASRPEVIFADEPTGNLDSRSGAEILGLHAPGRRPDGPDHRDGHPRPGGRRLRRRHRLPCRRADRRPDGGPHRRARARADEGVRGLTMFRATLKSIAAHKRRVLSTAMAVLLGVAFLSGTLVLGDTMRGGFADTFAEANAGTDALVRSATEVGEGEFSERGLLAQATLDQVRAVPGVATAEPLVDATGQIVGADGDPLGGNGPPTFAAAWIDDPGLNPWEVAEGRAPEADDEVVIDRQAAEDGDLAVGDTITIRTPAPVEAELVGIATFGDADGMGGPTYAAFTTAFAQRTLLAEPGQVTGVVVARRRLGERVGPGRLGSPTPCPTRPRRSRPPRSPVSRRTTSRPTSSGCCRRS